MTDKLIKTSKVTETTEEEIVDSKKPPNQVYSDKGPYWVAFVGLLLATVGLLGAFGFEFVHLYNFSSALFKPGVVWEPLWSAKWLVILFILAFLGCGATVFAIFKFLKAIAETKMEL